MVADTSSNGIYALNSALAALGTLQPWASLNRIDPSDSVSNLSVARVSECSALKYVVRVINAFL